MTLVDFTTMSRLHQHNDESIRLSAHLGEEIARLKGRIEIFIDEIYGSSSAQADPLRLETVKSYVIETHQKVSRLLDAQNALDTGRVALAKTLTPWPEDASN